MKNLLLISLDTVRADVAYNKNFIGIKELMDNGITFVNSISSSPLTPVSHASVLTGLFPSNHGIRHLFKERVNKDTPILGEILRNNGYSTGAIVSCPGLNAWYGLNRGFDSYDDEIPRLSDGSDPLKTVDVKLRGTALKRADLVVERAKKWLDENRKNPFFLFIHFFDAHWPYEAPIKFGGGNPYEQEIAYTDHYLHTFLREFKKTPHAKNTTIVCFSDHGEDLEGWYPNDKAGKLGRAEEFGHGCLLYDQTIKTVFIINDKDLPKGKKIEEQVRLIDVFPTILTLLKIDQKSPTDGISLLPLIQNKYKPSLVAYSETFYPEEKKPRGHEKNKISYRTAEFKLIINGNDNKDIEVYDLIKDPNEKKNLKIRE